MVRSPSVPKAEQKQQVRNTVRAGAALTPTYAIMNLLATVIACYGLLTDSTVVVIGAMVIAQLLGPIEGVGLALVDLDLPALRSSLIAELTGVAIVMGTAFVIGLAHKDIPLGQEILSRTHPGSTDLTIALASGIAATVATIGGGAGLSLVGVALATALVPPLATCSMLLARGADELATGAFLLAFANMVAIQFASSVVFWIAGFGNATRFWAGGYQVLRRNLVSLLLLVTLAVVLGVSTNRTVSTLLFETKVRKLLQKHLEDYPGAHLTEVRFDKANGETLVRAVVRFPGHFLASDVATLERDLPAAQDGTPVVLRVRRVGVEVMTSKGSVFETGEGSGSATHNDND